MEVTKLPLLAMDNKPMDNKLMDNKPMVDMPNQDSKLTLKAMGNSLQRLLATGKLQVINNNHKAMDNNRGMVLTTSSSRVVDGFRRSLGSSIHSEVGLRVVFIFADS
eukprot:m.116570 g.116570  ORF g.116570 m.116570 type:complete len:107 (-) comp15521_c0_seq7:1710-2030(-)